MLTIAQSSDDRLQNEKPEYDPSFKPDLIESVGTGVVWIRRDLMANQGWDMILDGAQTVHDAGEYKSFPINVLQRIPWKLKN